jgi:hypothetical protein
VPPVTLVTESVLPALPTVPLLITPVKLAVWALLMLPVKLALVCV